MNDILLTDDFGMFFRDGDFVVGESLRQTQMLLLVTNKGEWKQNPIMGIGVLNYIETHNAGKLQREIRSQFSLDGMQVSSVNMDGSILHVEAVWKN